MVIIKDKLKIKIVENHNEVRWFFLNIKILIFILFKVLPILIRDIGKNLNPGEDIALLRFDTYADFLVPKNVQANEIETLDHLIEYVKIYFFFLNN